MALSTIRANQKSALGLSGGLFNGVVAIEAFIYDAKRLTFEANISYETGDAQEPSVTFTPCNDDGNVRRFGALDDLIKWCQGTFLDMTEFSIVVDSIGDVSKTFVPPLDPIADALKQKAAFGKLVTGIQDNKVRANTNVNAAVAAGWNLSTAHPALQSNYAAIVAKRDAVVAIEAYYVGRVDYYDNIANP